MNKYEVGDLVRIEPENIDNIWTPFLKYVGREGYVINVHDDAYREARYVLDFCNVSWHEYNLQPAVKVSVNENDVLELFGGDNNVQKGVKNVL